MAQVEVKVMVSKEAFELALAVKEIVLAFKAKKPVVQIISEEFAAIQKAVDGISLIDDEMKADKKAFLEAFLLPVSDMVAGLLA